MSERQTTEEWAAEWGRRGRAMSGHTPGPWTVQSPAYGTLDVMGARGVCRLYTERAINDTERGPLLPEAAANARLIAAAPEMLEALRDCLEDFESLGGDGECVPCGSANGKHLKSCPVYIARTIIRKATGETD